MPMWPIIYAGLQMVDVSSPDAPEVVANVDTSGYVRRLAVDGNYAYLCMSTEGVRVVDVTDPLSPEVVAEYNTPGYATAVTIDGNYAYVGDSEQGLTILDVTDPTSPTFVGQYDSTAGIFGDVAVVGNYAYVVGMSSRPVHHRRFRSVDAVKADCYDTPGNTRGLDISGNYLYLADGTYGLKILDITDPGSAGARRDLRDRRRASTMSS